MRGLCKEISESRLASWRMLELNEASAIDAEDEQGLPRAMICPITTRFMRDPAITSEGQSYEYRAILNWLKDNDTDPVTMQRCSKQVYPNVGLRWLIRERIYQKMKTLTTQK